MNEKSLLLKTAQAVVKELWNRQQGTPMRLRWPASAWIGEVNTGGWRVKIGDLGKKQSGLQIWLDRFAGYESRKFNFCLAWGNVAKMRLIAKMAEKELPICRRVTHKHIKWGDGDFYFLPDHIKRNEFGEAVLEEYWERYSYFGIYDVTGRLKAAKVNPDVVARAAAFFETVARSLPQSERENEEHEVFPQEENRKLVTSHLRRERSRYLATERKIHDKYTCQVCGMRFKDIYGELGEDFAEAHHIIPLSKLRGSVKTRIEDLRTACANCHRMLHRMVGKRGDVEKLRAIVRKLKQKRRG
jgi:5-methylcytosine-specific restriction endonuclease McrA